MNCDNISVVLNKPRFPENIGACARVVQNMGIAGLAVVNPENFDPERVMKMATHAALEVVERVELETSLEKALANYQYVVGTTARTGGERKVVMPPWKAAEKLCSISENNRVALLFGPEDRGLTNSEIRLCHILVNIPTAKFSSLNLAQAVMILCYEILKAGKKPAGEFVPRLALRKELDDMYAQLAGILSRIHYINPENPDYWLNNLRHFCTRMQLRAKDVQMIRGICRQVMWYARKCYQDGVAGKSPDFENDGPDME